MRSLIIFSITVIAWIFFVLCLRVDYLIFFAIGFIIGGLFQRHIDPAFDYIIHLAYRRMKK